jgi:hypothetical protein
MKFHKTRQRETKTLKFVVETPAAVPFHVDLPRTFADGEPVAAWIPTEVRVDAERNGVVTIWLDVLMVAPF